MKPRILVILGPTATGKSDLAVQLAKKFNGEIISADSRQVYKGLDIGTGKITKKEMKGVRHHLLDVANPRKKFSVVKYKELAEKAIQEIVSRNNLPIIVGGTGFYIEALVDGVVLPEVPPDEELRKDLEKKDVATLFKKLSKLDPSRAKDIDPKNKRRIIRALEIVLALGKVPALEKSSKRYDSLFIGLNLPKEELQKRIHERLITRIRKGMEEEASRLHTEGLSWKRMNELGLEYRYLAMFLQNKVSRDEMIRKLDTETWHYAKRQTSWFNRDKKIKWFKPDEVRKIEKAVEKFLPQKFNK